MWQLNGEKDPKLVYGKGNQYKKKSTRVCWSLEKLANKQIIRSQVSKWISGGPFYQRYSLSLFLGVACSHLHYKLILSHTKVVSLYRCYYFYCVFIILLLFGWDLFLSFAIHWYICSAWPHPTWCRHWRAAAKLAQSHILCDDLSDVECLIYQCNDDIFIYFIVQLHNKCELNNIHRIILFRALFPSNFDW